MRDHLDRADALSSSPEIKLSREAFELQLRQNALVKRGADAGVDLTEWILDHGMFEMLNMICMTRPDGSVGEDEPPFTLAPWKFLPSQS